MIKHVEKEQVIIVGLQEMANRYGDKVGVVLGKFFVTCDCCPYDKKFRWSLEDQPINERHLLNILRKI